MSRCFFKVLAIGACGLVSLALSACNSSPSYGTPQDCTAAGGQCAIPGPRACVKEGPENTCNCNPGCDPGGAFCCIAFADGGADASPIRGAGTTDSRE